MRPLRIPPVLLGAWFVLVFAMGASGRMATLRSPAPQAVLAMLTLAAVMASWFVPVVRDWVAGLSVRLLVAVHLTRFVGIYFLWVHAQGQLPGAFAVPAGWGDIAVATLAVLLLLFVSPDTPGRRTAYLAWNMLGLLDILFVVATAGRLFASDPAAMEPMLRLPLSLLPSFLVPLIITSHLILFRKLRRPGSDAA